jgi:hypothetical protein
MSEKQTKTIPTEAAFNAESQKERWLKYGGNVALTVVVVILLSLLVVYAAESHPLRKDTTAGGIYSLKPQTVQLVSTLPQKVKLVGLFTKARHQEQQKKKADESDNPEIRYQQVSDLLQEYQQKSSGKVAVEMIDPITEPKKVDDLFAEVAKKYRNDVNKYMEIVKENGDYPKAVAKIESIAKEEISALQKLPEIHDRDIALTIDDVINTVGGFPPLLQFINAQVKKQLELKVPDYVGAVDAIKSRLGDLVENSEAILTSFKKLAANDKTPKPIKDYIASSQPRFEALKEAADSVLKKTQALGQLKQLDDLRQNKENTIAVMGENDMKVIPTASLFPPEDTRGFDPNSDNPRQRFAGEQQITTALYTLTHPAKRKIAFIRSGGQPLTMRMGPEAGPLATIADRLRDVDFEILEKDMSGMWAMQAMQLMQQGIPVPPDAKDEDIKDAVWVVLDTQLDPRAVQQNPAAGQIGIKLDQHLKAGGSALVLVNPLADDLSTALKDWGVEIKPDYVLFHEKITTTGARGEDPMLEYVKEQPFFLLKEYGDHLLTKPLRSLDGFFVPLISVSTKPVAGVKNSSLLPIPTSPKVWGERNLNELQEGKTVEYNPPKDGVEGDLSAPKFYAGAAAEKDKGRLVVLGCAQFAFNPILRLKDAQHALRFPANGELFVNSVYWLSKMDTMIAISPTALEVPRVVPMSDGLVIFWRFALVLGMPFLVLAAGAFVYRKRRD